MRISSFVLTGVLVVSTACSGSKTAPAPTTSSVTINARMTPDATTALLLSVPAARRYNALAKENGMTPTQMALAFCYTKWQVASTSTRRRLQIAIDIQIVDQTTSKVLWERKGLQVDGDYAERAEPHENWEDEVVPWVSQRLEEFGQVSVGQLWETSRFVPAIPI